MKNHYKHIYSSAAEVIGMSLKHMVEHEKSGDAAEWRESYMEDVAKMMSGIQASKPAQFITCVYMMQSHYKDVADK